MPRHSSLLPAERSPQGRKRRPAVSHSNIQAPTLSSQYIQGLNSKISSSATSPDVSLRASEVEANR